MGPRARFDKSKIELVLTICYPRKSAHISKQTLTLLQTLTHQQERGNSQNPPLKILLPISVLIVISTTQMVPFVLRLKPLCCPSSPSPPKLSPSSSSSPPSFSRSSPCRELTLRLLLLLRLPSRVSLSEDRRSASKISSSSFPPFASRV